MTQQKKNKWKNNSGGKRGKGGGFSTVSSAYRVRPKSSFHFIICMLFKKKKHFRLCVAPHDIQSVAVIPLTLFNSHMLLTIIQMNQKQDGVVLFPVVIFTTFVFFFSKLTKYFSDLLLLLLLLDWCSAGARIFSRLSLLQTDPPWQAWLPQIPPSLSLSLSLCKKLEKKEDEAQNKVDFDLNETQTFQKKQENTRLTSVHFASSPLSFFFFF